MHKQQLQQNLIYSHFSEDLFKQYQKHLGWYRFSLMTGVQGLLVPAEVGKLLRLKKGKRIGFTLWIYKASRKYKISRHLRNLLLPAKYKEQILSLERF
ncbi:hypothetical protein [Pedobacter rhodius]|uniref:Uncharacterized protein n=1 Tax=Pedobacter rhodius TaxID=3004098 RepID=A0ABT4KZ79_9SPHI|nr:hypothetical protein [Pedobacter sp. SJ11]MCZ4223153.1 hypothetical protein [Pedobacter sp. SJ11]